MTELTNSAIRVVNRPRIDSAWWAVVARFLIHGLVISTWVSRIPAIQKARAKQRAARLMFAGDGIRVGDRCSNYRLADCAIWQQASHKLEHSRLLYRSGRTIARGEQCQLFGALTIFGAMAGANDVSINSQGVAVESALAAPTMSRFHGMFSIGGMVGAGFGGLLAAPEVAPRMHLAIASALFLLCSLITAPRLLEADDKLTKRSHSFKLTTIPGALIGLVVIGFCMFLSEGAMADWSAVYLKQVLNAGPGLAASAYAAFSVGMAAFRLVGDRLEAWIGPVNTVRQGALLAAAALSLALQAPSPYWALPGFALTGAGFAVIVLIVFAAGGRLGSIPSGAGIAVVVGSGYIGFLFGPPLIGLLAQWSSLRTALLVVVGLSLLAAILANAVRGAKD